MISHVFASCGSRCFFAATLRLDPHGFRFPAMRWCQRAYLPVQGEAIALGQFRANVYACSGPLFDKRQGRDPFKVGVPSAASCPALAPFMTRKCLRHIFRGRLPWRQDRFQRAYVIAEDGA
jgi:hypothetical protein